MATSREIQVGAARSCGDPRPDGGRHAVVAEAPGYKRWRTAVQIADERDSVVVEVPALTPAVGEVDADDQDNRDAAEPGTFTPRRKAAIAFGVVGLSAIGGGIVLGISAGKAEDNARALCPDPAVTCAEASRANRYIDRGRSHAVFANIAYGVGGAAVVTGIVLWVTGAPARSTRASRSRRALATARAPM